MSKGKKRNTGWVYISQEIAETREKAAEILERVIGVIREIYSGIRYENERQIKISLNYGEEIPVRIFALSFTHFRVVKYIPES